MPLFPKKNKFDRYEPGEDDQRQYTTHHNFQRREKKLDPLVDIQLTGTQIDVLMSALMLYAREFPEDAQYCEDLTNYMIRTSMRYGYSGLDDQNEKWIKKPRR